MELLKMCSSSDNTHITGNVVVDLLILMLVGLIFMGLSVPSLYSDYKEFRQEKKKTKKILAIIILIILELAWVQLGTFIIGLIIFLVTFVSLIGEYVC
jgi:hypothetical protein